MSQDYHHAPSGTHTETANGNSKPVKNPFKNAKLVHLHKIMKMDDTIILMVLNVALVAARFFSAAASTLLTIYSSITTPFDAVEFSLK